VTGPARVALRSTEAALALLLLVCVLSVRDLPLVDLPQHALQLANWLRLDDGDPLAHAELELNFRTPYLLAYPILRALCAVVPIVVALKLVFWAAIALQAVTLRRLCARLGHDEWLGLLGYPLGMGYAFCFGFVAFCAAVPLVYLTFELVTTHRQAPSWGSGLKLSATLAALLVAHGVALGFGLLVCGPLLLFGGGKPWQRLLPLASPPLLAALWLAPGGTSTRLGGDLWALDAARFVELPAQLVGIGAVDHASTALGLLLLASVTAHLGAPRRAPFAEAPFRTRLATLLLWAPLAATLLGYGLFPLLFRGAGPLHPRFSSFLVPALLVAFTPRASRRGWQLDARRAAPLLVAGSVLALFASRLPEFQRETAGFHQLVSQMRGGLSVRPLVFARGSRAFPGIPAHLHLPAYYAVEKGGSAGYSFAMYAISVVRFRPTVRIKMSGGSEWAPEQFDAAQEAADYDYFLVKSARDRRRELFPGSSPNVTLEQHAGDWWSYRRAP